jgi:hypothetical protein
MPQHNFIDEAVENVAKRLIHMKEEADKADVVPVGMERATPDQMRKRLLDDPAYRKNTVTDENARDILKLFKGKS